jgi:hypothetical protein
MVVSKVELFLNQKLVLPEILETAARQFGVTHRVLDVPMAKVQLNCAGILASIREIEACRMSQHVRVHWKIDAGRVGRFGNYVMDRASCHWSAA